MAFSKQVAAGIATTSGVPVRSLARDREQSERHFAPARRYELFPKAGMMETRAFPSAMAPQAVAKAGYEGLMKEELFVLPVGMNKALVAARRILSGGAQARLNEKFYEESPRGSQVRPQRFRRSRPPELSAIREAPPAAEAR